jgi:uncharacterized glyoxalase superfamily protein PhnB
MSQQAVGALVGWKRTQTDHGVMLTMQLATSKADYDQRDFQLVQIALNDRQLRSLTRDLRRAAEARGIELWAKRRWWDVMGKVKDRRSKRWMK